VLDEHGNEIELKEDDDDEDIVYTTDSDDSANETVVDTNEVLESGFNIDEDGPEDIMDVFGDDTDTLDEDFFDE
jgi:hypothetical protein